MQIYVKNYTFNVDLQLIVVIVSNITINKNLFNEDRRINELKLLQCMRCKWAY